jgi:hypothetical protein
MFWLCLLCVQIAAIRTKHFLDYNDGDSNQLNCNWAQSYNDFDLLINCEEMQEEVMLLASHWEGKFAAVGVAPFADSMTFNWFIDRRSGALVKCSLTFFEACLVCIM